MHTLPAAGRQRSRRRDGKRRFVHQRGDGGAPGGLERCAGHADALCNDGGFHCVARKKLVRIGKQGIERTLHAGMRFFVAVAKAHYPAGAVAPVVARFLQ